MGASKEEYSTFDTLTKRFDSKDEVKDFLKEQYGNCKRKEMYVDDEKGNPVQIGWIYCFKNWDVSHGGPAWWQQDWVEVSEITVKDIVVLH